MKGLIEKINKIFRENKGYYIVVLVLFCVGIVIGTYTVKYMNTTDREDLSSYFTTFVNSISTKYVDYKSLLLNVVKKNICLIIPIIISMLTFIGIPVILVVDFIKGFTLGYTFTFLLTTFEGKGFLLALLSILPQNLIYIPCFIALSVIALQLSIGKFKTKFLKKSIKINMDKTILLNCIILIAGFFIIGIIVETYISPTLIKFVVEKIYA